MNQNGTTNPSHNEDIKTERETATEFQRICERKTAVEIGFSYVDSCPSSRASSFSSVRENDQGQWAPEFVIQWKC